MVPLNVIDVVANQPNLGNDDSTSNFIMEIEIDRVTLLFFLSSHHPFELLGLRYHNTFSIFTDDTNLELLGEIILCCHHEIGELGIQIQTTPYKKYRGTGWAIVQRMLLGLRGLEPDPRKFVKSMKSLKIVFVQVLH